MQSSSTPQSGVAAIGTMQSHSPLQPSKGSTELHPYINLSVLPDSTPLISPAPHVKCEKAVYMMMRCVLRYVLLSTVLYNAIVLQW